MATVFGQLETVKRVLTTLKKAAYKDIKTLDEAEALARRVQREYDQILKGEEITFRLDFQILVGNKDAAREYWKERVKEEKRLLQERIATLEEDGDSSEKGLLNRWISKLKVFYLRSQFDHLITKKTRRSLRDYQKLKEQCTYLKDNREELLVQKIAQEHPALVRQKDVFDRIKSTLIGAAGELKVAKELSRLPNGYFVFNDWSIQFRKPLYFSKQDTYIRSVQIDHLVVCAAGVFLIETKNWSKLTYYQNHDWTPADQVQRAGFAIYMLLNSRKFFKWSFWSSNRWNKKKVMVRNVVAAVNHKRYGQIPFVKFKSLHELNRYITYFESIHMEKEVEQLVRFFQRTSRV